MTKTTPQGEHTMTHHTEQNDAHDIDTDDGIESADLEAEGLEDLWDCDVWTDRAREEVRDVVDWFNANTADVVRYMEATGRDAEQVGQDFALSRSGHGTGLWDCGAGEVGDRLHKAAKVYGGVTLFVTRDENGDVVGIDA